MLENSAPVASALEMPLHSGSHPEALHACVRRAIRRYLSDMGDHAPEGFYSLVLAQVEKPLIEEVLHWAGGNQCRAASALGISRGTLRKKMQAHKIKP